MGHVVQLLISIRIFRPNVNAHAPEWLISLCYALYTLFCNRRSLGQGHPFPIISPHAAVHKPTPAGPGLGSHRQHWPGATSSSAWLSLQVQIQQKWNIA